MKTDQIAGYAAGIITGITYGLNPLFAMPLMREGANVDSILFFRYFEAENCKVFCILEGRKVVFNRIRDLFRDSTR